MAVQDGNLEKGCFLCGQAAAMVNKVQPAAEIVKEVCEGAEQILLKAPDFIN